MPLHRYICQDCQHLFEYLVRNTRQLPPQVTCPSCGSALTRRFVEEIQAGNGAAPGDNSPSVPSNSFDLKTLGRDLENKRRS